VPNVVFAAMVRVRKKTFLAFNSSAAIGGHDRQFFDKLLWGLITSTIFVR
jgi:hypothetical protein